MNIKTWAANFNSSKVPYNPDFGTVDQRDRYCFIYPTWKVIRKNLSVYL